MRSATKVTEKIIGAAKRLKVVGRAGIGVDNIDTRAATARGIIVMNTPYGNSITTAEHAISLMLALARQIPQADRSTKAGKWEKSKFMGVELFGKTLGVIGCGNIGSIVADRAIGLKMRVIAYDPFLSPERAVEIGSKVELDQLLQRADFITLHTPLTERTATHQCRGVGEDEADRASSIAPAAPHRQSGFGEALKAGRIAGAALERVRVEPAREPLFELDNVICTPHLGASTSRHREGRPADRRADV